MDRRRKFSKEEKVRAASRYLAGEKGSTSLAREVGCNAKTIHIWVETYREHGEEGFEERAHNRSYTKEHKATVVEEYLMVGSQNIIAAKNGISKRVLVNWIKEYNEGRLKDYHPMPEVYSMKGRRTTFEERKEIVKYCLEHDKNYKETAKVFSLPYSRVYMMVKKYIEHGEEGLMDARSRERLKPLTEVEKLQKENERLKKELELERLKRELVQKKNALEKERLQGFRKKTHTKR